MTIMKTILDEPVINIDGGIDDLLALKPKSLHAEPAIPIERGFDYLLALKPRPPQSSQYKA